MDCFESGESLSWRADCVGGRGRSGGEDGEKKEGERKGGREGGMMVRMKECKKTKDKTKSALIPHFTFTGYIE